MSSQQLDEEAIVAVAREIRNPEARSQYLAQVCDDPKLRVQLEQRLTMGGRWQFGLRSLFLVVLIVALVSGLVGIYLQAAMRVRRAWESASRAQLQAERARFEAAQRTRQLQAAQRTANARDVP